LIADTSRVLIFSEKIKEFFKEHFKNSTIDGLSRTQNSQESIATGAVIMGSELFYVKHRLLKPEEQTEQEQINQI